MQKDSIAERDTCSLRLSRRRERDRANREQRWAQQRQERVEQVVVRRQRLIAADTPPHALARH